MKRKMVVVLTFTFLSACAPAHVYEKIYPHVEPAPAPSPLTGPVATKADLAKAHAAVKGALRDPMSALFSGEFFQPGAVCGAVNSKNAYGGYAGNVVYAYVISTGEVLLLTGEASVENVNIDTRISVFCHH
jgi:hypothetical protein